MDEAFGKLMEAFTDQVLQAESTEQLGAEEVIANDLKNVLIIEMELGQEH